MHSCHPAMHHAPACGSLQGTPCRPEGLPAASPTEIERRADAAVLLRVVSGSAAPCSTSCSRGLVVGSSGLQRMQTGSANAHVISNSCNGSGGAAGTLLLLPAWLSKGAHALLGEVAVPDAVMSMAEGCEALLLALDSAAQVADAGCCVQPQVAVYGCCV